MCGAACCPADVEQVVKEHCSSSLHMSLAIRVGVTEYTSSFHELHSVSSRRAEIHPLCLRMLDH